MRLLSSVLVLSLFLVPLALAQLDAPVEHTDPADDVRAGGEDVELPEGDIVRAVAERNGDEVVVTITTAADMRGNAGLTFEGFYMVNQFFTHKVAIQLENLNLTEAEGRRTRDAQAEEQFDVQVTRDGSELTLRWPASAIPSDAECFDFAATLHTPQPRGNAEDRAGWDITKRGSCTPSSGNGGASDGSSGGSSDGASSGSEQTPGIALPLPVVAVAAAALAFARRR